MALTQDDYGRKSCELHFGCGLSWADASKVIAVLREEDTSESAARSACLRYRKDLVGTGSKYDFGCPVDLKAIADSVLFGAGGKEVDGQSSASFTIDGNEAELSVTARHPIKTLEELIESHQIDTEKWVISGKVIHNTWTTPAFDRSTNEWTNFQNHQVKAPFVLKHPKPVYPQIQPIESHTIYPPGVVNFSSGDIQRQMYVADLHVGFTKDLYTAKLEPFHDRRAIDVALQIAQYAKPDVLVVLGDAIDAAELSDKFLRDPATLGTLEPALVELYWTLDQFRSVLPDADIVYIEGNHEERMRRWLLAHFPAVYNLRRADALEAPPVLSFENLIALQSVGVRWIPGYPDNYEWLAGIRASHGDTARKQPGSTGWATIQDADDNEVYGHIHREELVTKSIDRREVRHIVRAFCPGCLCRTDGAVPGSSASQYWSQGVVLRDVVVDDSVSRQDFISIDNGRAIVDRQMISYRDRVGDLRDAYPSYSW